ncbi:ELO family [Trinorchestia longiramus]|nr:ELO family [Trinorchestia longiramus]
MVKTERDSQHLTAAVTMTGTMQDRVRHSTGRQSGSSSARQAVWQQLRQAGSLAAATPGRQSGSSCARQAVWQQLRQAGSLAAATPGRQSGSSCARQAVWQQLRQAGSLAAAAPGRQSGSSYARQAVWQQLRQAGSLAAAAPGRQSGSSCARQAVWQQLRLGGSLAAAAPGRQSGRSCARQAVWQQLLELKSTSTGRTDRPTVQVKRSLEISSVVRGGCAWKRGVSLCGTPIASNSVLTGTTDQVQQYNSMANTQLVGDTWLQGGVGGMVRSAYKAYSDVLSRGDPRLGDWFLMQSPLPTTLICLTYVWIVKVAGPRFMKDREPYQFKNIIIFYNFIQVVFSMFIFYEIGMGGWLVGYDLRCQPVDYSDGATSRRMLNACYWYFISKFTEFFDTFFFVLRKKNQHVSLLHVLHHGIMPISTWVGMKFTPGGHSTFFGFLNTFVHIVMYFYYMVAAMGPRYQKYIWWKKYLTTLQIVQFVLIFIHAFQLVFRECNYPSAFMWWIGGHALMFFCLFADFYVKAYRQQIAKKNAAVDMVKKMVPCFLLGSDQTNPTSSGKQNGHTNGHLSNGHANGHISNGSVHSASSQVRERHVSREH